MLSDCRDEHRLFWDITLHIWNVLQLVLSAWSVDSLTVALHSAPVLSKGAVHPVVKQAVVDYEFCFVQEPLYKIISHKCVCQQCVLFISALHTTNQPTKRLIDHPVKFIESWHWSIWCFDFKQAHLCLPRFSPTAAPAGMTMCNHTMQNRNSLIKKTNSPRHSWGWSSNNHISQTHRTQRISCQNHRTPPKVSDLLIGQSCVTARRGLNKILTRGL